MLRGVAVFPLKKSLCHDKFNRMILNYGVTFGLYLMRI